MVLNLGPITVANELGLYAFLSLIPLIIIYLIRPRPKSMKIPSLMFFTKDKGSPKMTAFFRRIVKDLLFIMHLLIIILLAAAIASPFMMVNHDITAENTVIVIDVSASSQVKEGGKTRFQLEVSKAKDLLGGKNTVILAKGVATVGLESATKRETIAYLNKLKPLDTKSEIGEAIILAGEILSGKEGRVIVLSDFINTEGTNPNTAKQVLESKNIAVNFINVATDTKKKNVGIIDMNVKDEETTIYIKNFNDKDAEVEIEINGEPQTLTIPLQYVEPLRFETPEGITKIEIKESDDFPVDNIAYVSAPERETVSVLIVTNNESSFLKSGFNSSQIADVTIAEPPVVPKDDFDVFVFHNIDHDELLPGTMQDIKNKIEKGSSLIIHAQEGMENINYKGMFPLDLKEKKTGGPVTMEQLTAFTKDMLLGSVTHMYDVEKKNGNLVTIASVDNIPLITFSNLGNGKVIYFGVMEESSDFRFAPSYPIFWTNLLKFLTNQKDISNLNARSGDTLVMDKVIKVDTPYGVQKTNTLIYEYSGIYNIGSEKLAVNLLDEKESDVNLQEETGESPRTFTLSPIKQKREFNFEFTFAALALMILLVELVFIKSRGDI
jgi:hypothetical protein